MEKCDAVSYLIGKGFIEIDRDMYYLDLDSNVTERINLNNYLNPLVSVSKNGKFLPMKAEMTIDDMKKLESIGLNPFMTVASRLLS